MYIIYALLGAVMASLGTIFAKLGLKGVDANLLTAIRGIVICSKDRPCYRLKENICKLKI